MSDTAASFGAHATDTANATTVMGGLIGNIVEWYDWTIYGLLSSVFASQFFPSGNATTALLATLATFALGFVMRPVGSIVLSPLADKYGRRRMLALTILLMGLGSLIVAVTPSYASIGIAAPILLLVARLLQGFSAGGEFQGAAAFLVEHAPAHRRGVIGSLHIASIGFAVLIATGIAALTTNFITPPALGTWGWRLPFLLGAALSLYGLYIRTGLPETPHFIAVEQRRALHDRPILRALRDHPWELFVVFAMQMGTVQFYLWTVFLPTYAHLAGGLPLGQGFIGGVISLAVFCVATPAAGAVSDRIGRRPVLLTYAIGFFVLAWPMLRLLQHADFLTFLLVDIVGCLLLAMADGVLSATLCELFPTQVRTSGIGLPYAVCAAIFGGTAPLIATWLLSRQLSDLIAAYIMAIAAIGCVTFLRKAVDNPVLRAAAQPTNSIALIINPNILQPASPQPVARPRPLAGSPIRRVCQPATIDRQAAAADARCQTRPEAFQLRDLRIDPPGPVARQPRPVAARRNSVGRQPRQFHADLLQRQPDPLREHDERDPPQHRARIAPMPGPCPLRRNQPSVFVKSQGGGRDAAAPRHLADQKHRFHARIPAQNPLDFKFT